MEMIAVAAAVVQRWNRLGCALRVKYQLLNYRITRWSLLLARRLTRVKCQL